MRSKAKLACRPPSRRFAAIRRRAYGVAIAFVALVLAAPAIAHASRRFEMLIGMVTIDSAAQMAMK
jgi:hypothetical protein